MNTSRTLLIFTLFFFLGCGKLPNFGENETTQAEDYYPFVVSDNIIYSWRGSTNITVFVPSDADSAGITEYKATFRTQILAAISRWQEILTELGITLTVVDSGQSDIKILWDDGTKMDVGVLGLASYNPYKNPSRYLQLTTRLKKSSGGYRDLVDSEIYSISVHEFGHILGIWSHSYDEKDLMYPILTDITDLSLRDKATFRKLYSIPADFNFGSLDKNSIHAAILSCEITDQPGSAPMGNLSIQE